MLSFPFTFTPAGDAADDDGPMIPTGEEEGETTEGEGDVAEADVVVERLEGVNGLI